MRTMTVLQRFGVAALVVAMAASVPVAHAEDVAKVSALRLEKGANSSVYIIEQTGEAAYQEFLLPNPKRLVLDLVGAVHGLPQYIYDGDGRLVKGVRTSQFTNDPDEVTRIVFDMVDEAEYKVSRREGIVEVTFFGDVKADDVMDASVSSAWDADADATPKLDATAKPAATQPEPAKTAAQPESAKATPAQPQAKPAPTQPAPAKAAATQPEPAQAAPTQPAPVQPTPAQPAPAKSMADPAPVTSWDTEMARAQAEVAEEESRLAAANPWTAKTDGPVRSRSYPAELTAYTSAGAARLSNDRISMDVQGADMKTVLRSISEFSGANIVTGPDVEGPVTIHLVDVPWREALDIILKANGYGLREEYGMFRIQSLDVLHDEEIDIATTRQKKEDLEPLVSKVIELNYVNAKEMQQAMDKATSKRGSIAIEKGSNAIIINDIPKITERVAAMAVSLDKRVSMVEIVAKMVDLDVEATRELGIQWDFMNIMSTDFHATMNAFSGQQLAAPFAGFNIGTVQSWGQVMAAIEALERDNKANIISNPRITTADNNEASILVGKEIPLIVSDEAGNPITELKKTGITLRVTPHVNSDGTITMDLHPEISDLSSQATVQGGLIISISEADTRVIVRDGETAVIGGLLSEIESHTTAGVPGLKDVPVLGALFRFDSRTKKKRELVIFVTPKLVEFGASVETGMQ